MCQWYCTSDGPFTNLHCLHCHTRYCGACLHGEAGKMESLVKCASCGKKPRVKPNAQRRGWGHEVASPTGTSKTVISPPQRGKTAAAYWAYKNAADSQGQFTWDASPQGRTIFDKLTDPTLYTGSHKHRFDEEGRGRGLEGRDSVAKGLGTGAVTNYYGDGPVISIAQLVRNDKLDPSHMNKVRKFEDGTSVLSPNNRSWKHADTAWRPDSTPRGVYPSNNPTYQRTPGSTPRTGYGSARKSPLGSSHSTASLQHDITTLRQPGEQHGAAAAAGWTTARSQPNTPGQQRPASASYHASPIFDKLTDPNLYTGTHRQRFDEQGRGLGLAGRVEVEPERFQGDAYVSPVIHDLSQITRTQFNVGSPRGKTGHKFLY